MRENQEKIVKLEKKIIELEKGKKIDKAKMECKTNLIENLKGNKRVYFVSKSLACRLNLIRFKQELEKHHSRGGLSK